MVAPKSVFRVILLLSLLGFPRVQASELRLDGPGGSMHGLPVYSQIGATCYAYAAANAIDAWRNSQGPLPPEERTNPFELAVGNGQLAHGQIRLEDTVSGGGLCPVVRYARLEGVCTQRVLPLQISRGPETSEAELIEADAEDAWVEKLGSVIRGINGIHKKYRALSCAERSGEAGDELVSRLTERLESYGLPSGRFPESQELKRALRKSTQRFQRAVLTDPFCDGLRTPLELPGKCYQEATVLESPARIISKIDKRLVDARSQPVGIAYCSKLLRKGISYRGFSHRLWDFDFVDTDACGGHVSLITGKRIRAETGKLEFLIHNSWGDGCKRYSPDWECRKGKIWVDAGTLAENTYGLMGL